MKDKGGISYKGKTGRGFLPMEINNREDIGRSSDPVKIKATSR